MTIFDQPHDYIIAMIRISPHLINAIANLVREIKSRQRMGAEAAKVLRETLDYHKAEARLTCLLQAQEAGLIMSLLRHGVD